MPPLFGGLPSTAFSLLCEGVENIPQMKKISIEHLAYVIKQAKDNNLPQPIFFLGAGASASGDIPSANGIIERIQGRYGDSPSIRELDKKDKTYIKLMGCLSPYERNELLKGIIGEGKINVTHIYLAQLLKEGYADYILTVNFDNLMLRALALFNVFPATYDMAILKDLTTTAFKEKSIVYLHGQHHGLWLLNTEEEMDKVKEIVPRIFDSIKNGRPWVFIGYSASDPIFDHVKSLGRFDNGLYWVGYNNDPLNDGVAEFLNTPNVNGFYIKGYDSDAFMLELNQELGLEQPEILSKPFSSLQTILDEIKDVDNEEHFRGVKERLRITKGNVIKAISLFEKRDITINNLKREIIAISISGEYDAQQIGEIEKKVKYINESTTNSLLADLYFNWGKYLYRQAMKSVDPEATELYYEAAKRYKRSIEIDPRSDAAFYNLGLTYNRLAEIKTDQEATDFYHRAIEMYEQASIVNPQHYDALSNWGSCLSELAKNQTHQRAQKLYEQSNEKYQKALEVRPDFYGAWVNLGLTLGRLAKFKKVEEAIELYEQAFEKYRQAIGLNPTSWEVLNNWGIHLVGLATIKTGLEANILYQQAIEKHKEALKIKPDEPEILRDWAICLGEYAKTKKGQEGDKLFQQAFEKCREAVALDPVYSGAFDSWGTFLRDFARTKTGEEADELRQEALRKYQKASQYSGLSYNLACWYAESGSKQEALSYLDTSLAKKEISTDFVLEDKDWKHLLNDAEFKAIIKRYRN